MGGGGEGDWRIFGGGLVGFLGGTEGGSIIAYGVWKGNNEILTAMRGEHANEHRAQRGSGKIYCDTAKLPWLLPASGDK